MLTFNKDIQEGYESNRERKKSKRVMEKIEIIFEEKYLLKERKEVILYF